LPLFGRKASEETEQSEAPKRDPRKARPWFDRAKTVADAQNYDYAINCYISGLLHEPAAMDQHETLREVSLKRKVQGGKPAGWRDKPPVSGKSHVEKMLEAEFYFAKDPNAASQALKMMEEAMAATREGEADLSEVAFWVGDLAITANRSSKRPSKQVYLKVRDLFSEMERPDKAAEACSYAVQLDPQNAELVREMRDLQAETTLMKGGYGGEEGGFRQAVKDADKQKALEQEDQIARTDEAQEEVISRLRQEYEDNPDDVQALEKLVRALRERQTKAAEDEAIQLLESAHQKFGQYRFKMQMGDIRMRQFKRALRDLKKRLDDEPSNEELKRQYRKLAAAQAKFELDEYAERVKNYPTDMALRYELGRRQFALGQYDEAIASFQEAQADPKHRSAAMRYLGEAFYKKGWYDDAVDIFRRGLEAHAGETDRLAMELRYDLMDALAEKAKTDKDLEAAQEASRIGSQIAQTDINFRDIRTRVDDIRQFVNDLKQAHGA
jgi:tetratricopeptide (TPR) repeat protein